MPFNPAPSTETAEGAAGFLPGPEFTTLAATCYPRSLPAVRPILFSPASSRRSMAIPRRHGSFQKQANKGLAYLPA